MKKPKVVNGSGQSGATGKQAQAAPVLPLADAIFPDIAVPVAIIEDSPHATPAPSHHGAPGRRMSASAIARECGVSRQRVQRLLKQGHQPAEIIESSARRKATAAALRDESASSRSGVSPSGGNVPPLLADSIRRKEASLAELRSLEVARLRGELIPAAQTSLFVAGSFVAARQSLESLPEQLSGDLAQASDKFVIEAMLRDAIARALRAAETNSETLARSIGARLDFSLQGYPPQIQRAIRTIGAYCNREEYEQKDKHDEQ